MLNTVFGSQTFEQPCLKRTSKAKKFLTILSVMVIIPFVLTETASADLNLFQKKTPQVEPQKEPSQAQGVVSDEKGAEAPAANSSETVSSIANSSLSVPNPNQASVMSSNQTSGFPKILVVDVQGVLISSAVGKDIKKQFDDKQAAFMKEIETEEGELKKTEQDLLRQRTVLSQDVFAKKKAEFDERMVSLNTKFQKNRQILEEAFNLARTDVESKLLDVIKEVKNEQSANLVLPAQQVIMGDDQMDVTAEVLDRFNKKVPSYKVNF